MKRMPVPRLALAIAVCVLAAACTQAAPAPAPTKAPEAPKAAEPTKAPAAEPTKAAAAAPAAQPTAAPAKKVDFPQKGKTITMLIANAAGGSVDVAARLLATDLEKQFGSPVEVVNKPGGGMQVGLTEFVRAKPDGYTIGGTNQPNTSLTYLDAQRKAPYGRKDFQPLATFWMDPTVIAVAANSPYKDMKALIDAAKANPGKIRAGDLGFGNDDHMDILMIQKLSGAKFSIVHFDGSPTRNAALLGGNLEWIIGGAGAIIPMVKSGELRLLAVLDTEESPMAPGVKTLKSQGYDMTSIGVRALALPAGTPAEIIPVLEGAIKKTTEQADFKDKIANIGGTVRFEDSATLTKRWDQIDVQVKDALDLVAAEAAKK